jgi:phage terminase large subunit-like protein
VVITRGRTMGDAANLSAHVLDELLELYAGTRLGRQELDAELLDDVEGAPLRSAWTEAGRVDKVDVPALPRAILPGRPGRYRGFTCGGWGCLARA